ncbi:phosphotransferase family protein [Rhodococcoides fascians]|uniref:phosphotransferase family protein n=1 Tax=Rhodococcoides fascians TaxID=1828 RepID=UPI00055C5EA4|nr:phosphotransferase family protein [Rhodococcus fascians]
MTQTSHTTTDSPLDLTAVAEFLRAALPHEDVGDLTAAQINGGKSNLTYRVTDGDHRWILRRPPLGTVLHSSHDVGREFRVMQALHGSAVPVPAVVAHCPDASVIGAPFYVMDQVDGVVLGTRELVSALSDAQRHKLGNTLVDTLVALHEIDPADVGLDTLGNPTGYLARQLNRWVRQFEAIEVRPLPQVDTLADKLARAMPEHQGAAIVHGDYRIDNVITAPHDPGSIAAVLDWEMATLGDPLSDLGILVSFWDEPGQPHNPITNGLTAFDGFPTADEVVARYAEQRNIDSAVVDWYRVFGLWKVAVILEQIYARHHNGFTVGAGFDDVEAMPAILLERASEIAASSSLAALRH